MAARIFRAAFALFIGSAQPCTPKKEGNTPQTGKADYGVDNAAQHSAFAEQPGHQIKLEKTNKPPVYAANDGEDQRKNIHSGHLLVCFY